MPRTFFEDASVTDAQLASELQTLTWKIEETIARDDVAIEKLLCSVQEAKLSGRWRKNRFSLLDVLGRPRLEEAHSSFLAWILDPAEAHGLGDAFLREFIRRSGGEAISTAEVSVSREYPCGPNRFDIHVQGNGWCLIVENKIDDRPWERQCHNYEEHQKLRDRGQKATLVYVTPALRPPGAIPWLSYRDVRLMLESLTPDPSAASAIDDFCEHILTDLE